MRLRIPAFVAGAALLVLLPGIRAPYAYDDGPALAENPHVLAPDVRRLAVPPPNRTLAELSLAANRLAGTDPAALRMGGALLHAGSSVLVAFLATALGADPLLAGLLFAVHPVSAQTATYLAQRSTLLETFLAFACLLLHLRARRAASPLRSPAYWAAWGLACLALWAKETSVTIPLSLAALEWILPGPRGRLLRLAPYGILPLAGALQFVWLRGGEAYALPAAMESATGRPLPLPAPLEYLWMQGGVVLDYLRRSLLPFPLPFWHPREVPWAASAAAGVVLLPLAGWLLLGRPRLPRLALALFLAPLALESSVFPILDLAWNHRMYPSLLGTALLFGLLPRRGLVALALLGLLGAAEARRWTAPPSLLTRDVRHAPRVELVWGTLAWKRIEQGSPGRALRLSEHACRSGRVSVSLSSAGAVALHRLGLRDASAARLGALTREFPRHEKLLFLAGQLAQERGDAQALALLEDAAGRIERPRRDLALWLGRRLAETGRLAEAERVLSGHVGRCPWDAGGHDYLGQVLMRLERASESESEYEKAVALDPGLPKAWFNLAVLRERRGDRAAAVEALRQALRADPGYALAHRKLEALSP